MPLNPFPDACIILDNKDQIVAVSPAGEKLFGLADGDMMGKTLAEICSGQAVIVDLNEVYYNMLPGYAEIKVSSLQGWAGEDLGQVMILRTLLASPQYEMLMALQETTYDLHSSLDIKVVLHNIVERACKLLGTAHGYLVTLRETGEMEPVVGIGALTEMLKYKVIPGENMAGIVWKTGKPLFIPDFDAWSRRGSEFPRGLIRTLLGIPLVLHGQVLGVIGVGRGYENDATFSEEDIAVLSRFAELAVLALQNARLFQQAQAEIEYRRRTEVQLRNANQVLQFQLEKIELLQGQMHELAVRDALTNLFNRRYLEEMLRVEFARAKRSKTSAAILMLDCDRLKFINDMYGHKAGDDSLVHIADVIRDCTRAGDIACRYGGDEFVVILGNVNEKTALERAEELRTRIAAEHIVCKKKKVYMSVSIGIAMYPTHGIQGESLLNKADQALYGAKGGGKNQVVVYCEDLVARG